MPPSIRVSPQKMAWFAIINSWYHLKHHLNMKLLLTPLLSHDFNVLTHQYWTRPGDLWSGYMALSPRNHALRSLKATLTNSGLWFYWNAFRLSLYPKYAVSWKRSFKTNAWLHTWKYIMYLHQHTSYDAKQTYAFWLQEVYLAFYLLKLILVKRGTKYRVFVYRDLLSSRLSSFRDNCNR